MADLPLPDGSFARVWARARTAVAPDIAARFPELQTFSVESCDGSIAGRLRVGPGGVFIRAGTPEGLVHVEPVYTARGVIYVSYFERDRTTAVRLAAAGSAR